MAVPDLQPPHARVILSSSVSIHIFLSSWNRHVEALLAQDIDAKKDFDV